MSNNRQQQLSRRDWFRLRLPKPEPDLLGADESGEMQPVADPPNHDGLDLSELPPVHEAILQPEQIRALFQDLERHATNVQLLARGASATDEELAEYLHRTCEGLIEGRIKKLQVRYVWQEARWIDTLELKPNGIRIVRIKHDC
jgi:hypothetical protein